MPPLAPPQLAAPVAAPSAATPSGASRCHANGAAFESRLAERLAAVEAPTRAGRAPLEALLRGAEAAQARLDALLGAARRGQGLTAGDLLVLQAEAYRATQVLEVAGKVVEQGVQSVKQAIQTPL